MDLVIREGRKLIPVEIKSAATFTEDFAKGLEQFRKTIGSRYSTGYVFYNGFWKLGLSCTSLNCGLTGNGCKPAKSLCR